MTDIYPIKGLDHLEFYVGNARQAASFYSKCFGLTNTAYQGLETGERKTTSYVLEQGTIRFVFSSALSPDYPIAHSVLIHGDTVGVVALEVSDVFSVYRHAISKGAVGAIPPTNQEDDHGVLRYAAVRAFGDLLVKFVDRSDYTGVFAPGFVAQPATPALTTGLRSIDHVVGNVEQGTLACWVNFFAKTLGFEEIMSFDEQVISTEYSALTSKVLRNGNCTINVNEPAPARRRSQIQEFLDYHHGPGIQHIALATDDIAQTVMQLRQAGVEFLKIPRTYYEDLADWVQEIDIPIEKLAELGILVDRDQDGYLLQLFTKPVGDRPTLFFEIIQRQGAKGFGAGNFKSLFLAIEREQAARGNL